jgi:hypothetical protein
MDDAPLTNAGLDSLEALCNAASPAPWTAMVEGRDHTSGDSFIRLGGFGDDRQPDMYVSHESRPATVTDLDFIAAARNSLPQLIAEIRRLRSLS